VLSVSVLSSVLIRLNPSPSLYSAVLLVKWFEEPPDTVNPSSRFPDAVLSFRSFPDEFSSVIPE